MKERYESACPHMLDHLCSVEGLLDIAIVSGFSFGANKALFLQTEGKLLGDMVGRHGIRVSKDITRAVFDFAR